ncbi:hypothetical protein N7462_003940 [Penicillium macrosclerotiorum]|uniref:uncharacterized protein n=1 Tax=Penicillium macrosclerotiorum TaxID=303699 RepID=UPI002546A736|nr:uncharacterized protein N7462_003940 [Penicillium macrosclerotiorum]KAJ5689548.1 hypothetical protein N7462_003940 [Penicillium macrosclerotiorum]
MTYVLVYPQFRVRRWTMRQTGVFYHHNEKEPQDLWVFFHAGQNTLAQISIENILSQSEIRLDQGTIWSSVHAAVFSPYLKQWNLYLHYLGSKVDEYVTDSLTLESSGMDDFWTANGDGKLLDLHYYGDLILPTRFRLEAILSTLERLEEISHQFFERSCNLETGYLRLALDASYYRKSLQGLLPGIEVLGEKVKDVLQRLQIGLNLRMNHKMLSINDELLKLGNQNFDENATVKVVTFVTMIYLPASLVSSVLGMNLFKFDDGTTEEFTISKQFWIFIVATIVLAILTVGLWYIWTHKEQKRRMKSRITGFWRPTAYDEARNELSEKQLERV